MMGSINMQYAYYVEMRVIQIKLPLKKTAAMAYARGA
jgi:hypothetical protein